MSDIQTNQAIKLPNVEQFKRIVNEELHRWSQSNVSGLCTDQTQTVIDNLKLFYGDPTSRYTPDVETFKRVIEGFREQKERTVFAAFPDTEVLELVARVAPLFQEPPKVEEKEDTQAI